MSALILKGAPVAAKIQAELAPGIAEFRKKTRVAPTLAIVRVGNHPSAVSYALAIDRLFTSSAMGFQIHVLPEDAPAERLIEKLNELARADDIHGILLQRPLPHSIDANAVAAAIPVAKDVEGVTATNIGKLALGVPDAIPTSTPSAALEILKYYEIPIAGKRAVVVGRSNILGKPMALMLLNAHATVIVAHSRTRDLAALTRQADVLVAAAGRPRLITADMVAPGAVVVDFGVNIANARIVGDVDFDSVKEIASAISPVPGGTGPVSAALLMRNTLRVAEREATSAPGRGRMTWFPLLKSERRA